MPAADPADTTISPATERPGRSRRRRRHRAAWPAILALAAAAVVPATLGQPAAAAKETTVHITLTPDGCKPKPAKVHPGPIQFDVANENAGAVSEAELRTSDMSHLLGEQENLTPGLSGGFGLTLQPGHYVVYCPGASKQHARFRVAGKASGVHWQSSASLSSAVSGYADYVNQQVSQLVSSTQTFCAAVDAGDLDQAQILYPQARVFYERIEPVAAVWGTLDTEIDGRWENPVTVKSQFVGFHRLEQLMWSDDTLDGAPALCSDLVHHEQQLQQLVAKAQYNPTTMAAGATDLINEAGTSKITGEEERYSNVDLPVFQANVDGAMEVVSLLRPYISQHHHKLMHQIEARHHAVESAIGKYKASPGYDQTGYVEYSTVLDSARRTLSGKVQAFAEALSKMTGVVG